jgi:hypothetical protein
MRDRGVSWFTQVDSSSCHVSNSHILVKGRIRSDMLQLITNY